MKEIELPDYLPARYRSWLHLYRDIVRTFKERGYPLTEQTEVKLNEFGFNDPAFFYHSFTLGVIKSRALDYVLSELPSYLVLMLCIQLEIEQ